MCYVISFLITTFQVLDNSKKDASRTFHIYIINCKFRGTSTILNACVQEIKRFLRTGVVNSIKM